MLKSQKQSIQKNIRLQKRLRDLDKKTREVKAELSPSDKSYSMEYSRNRQEVNALYEEILKALS
jgi:hypothetical protein